MKKFQPLEALPETSAELDEYAAKIRAAINVFQARAENGEEFTAEDVAELESLNEEFTKADTKLTEIITEEQTRAERLDAALAAAKAATAPKPAPEPEAPAKPVEEAPVEVPAEAAAEVVAEAEQATQEAAAPAAVTAAAPEPPVSFAGAAPAGDVPVAPPTPGKPRGWKFAASAPNVTSITASLGGEELVGFREIAESLASVENGAGVRQTGTTPDGKFAKQSVATLARPQVGKVIENERDFYEALETLGTEIPGHGKVSAKALVAAGGWCAPSEQVYGFCAVPPASDLISLPDWVIKRGGVRFPVNPDISALLDGLWHFTEAQLEAVDGSGNPTAVKPIIELPCPDQFIEYRLEAIGWAAKAGILMRQAWPEAIENALEQISVAHQHRVSQLTIGKMVAGSGTPIQVPADSVLGATSSVLNGLALQAANLRYNKGLAGDATIEGVAPVWFREVLRADLALRDGKDSLAVTNAEIDSWLAAREIYLQYVVDWQTRGTGQPGNMATVRYPSTVDVLLYPAGTWFRSLDNVITLGVQYPLEQLVLNQYTHIFTEDSLQVGKRCDQSIIVRLPLCVSGAVGARQYVACNTPAETP